MRNIEQKLEVYHYEKLKTYPQVAREMRIRAALEADCIFPEDGFIERVKGTNPEAVYNAVAGELGYPKLRIKGISTKNDTRREKRNVVPSPRLPLRAPRRPPGLLAKSSFTVRQEMNRNDGKIEEG